MNRREILALGAAAAAAPLLPRRAHAAGWDEVIKTAKSEGSVQLYATVTGNIHAGVIKAFQDKFGITINQISGNGTDIPVRIQTEQAAGRFNADVTINGADTVLLHKTSGNLQPYGDLPGVKGLPGDTAADPEMIRIYYQYYCALINTKLVPPDQEPKSWNDFLDPKWMGKILFYDPRVIGPGAAWFRGTTLALGEDFQRKMLAQKPVVFVDWGTSRRRVVTGEYPIMIPDNYNAYFDAHAKGLKLPIKPLVPREGSPASDFAGAILRNAPHPNAARLFLDFVISPEAQTHYASLGSVPVLKTGVADKFDPDLRALLEQPMMKQPPGSEQQKYLDLAKDIYGKA